jgi:hypothetical protein
MNGTNPTNKETTMLTDDASARFLLLEMDGPTPAPVTTFVPKLVPSNDDGGSISVEGKARAEEDEAAAVQAGWSLKPPVYAIGSKVNSTGVANFRASRQEHDSKASVGEACEQLINLVEKEDRRDLVVKVPTLSMLPDGRITRGGGPLDVSERAITGVGTMITPGGASYLRACPPDLRAVNFNHWSREGWREDQRATSALVEKWDETGRRGPKPEPVMVEKEVTLRTRLNHASNKREAWSFVGPRYEAHDINDIAAQIMRHEAIPADAKCDIVYDGYKARIDVLFHTDIQPEKAVAGEIFKAGIMVKTADDGSGSIQISAQVFRNLCLNLIIIDHAKDLVTRRRHFGKGIEADITTGIEVAMGKVKYFADKWSEATLENVIEKYGVNNVEDVLRGLVFNKVVHVSGVKPDEMFDRLLRAYQAEPGYGRDAIVNAVTRCAHSETWSRWTDVEDLERKGGELLFAKAWNVAISDEDREALTY